MYFLRVTLPKQINQHLPIWQPNFSSFSVSTRRFLYSIHRIKPMTDCSFNAAIAPFLYRVKHAAIHGFFQNSIDTCAFPTTIPLTGHDKCLT
jgi:hypothetical protein